jgi:hypothetical protein
VEAWVFGLIDKSKGYLFSSRELREIIASSLQAVRQEVEQLDGNRLLNSAPADLVRYVVDKYGLTAPTLKRDAWSATEQEIQVDVRHDQRRYITDRSRPALIPGQRIEIEVPIEGDTELLYAQASTVTMSPPRAVVRGSSLFLTFEIAHDAGQGDVRQDADRILNEIEQHLGWIKGDLSGFNERLAAEAERAIAARRDRILANQGRASALGIPLKARPDAPKTYAVPQLRRKLAPSLPAATTAAFVPEPALDMANYEHILSVLQNMAHVMERSPSAFETMREEDLRQHFLVQLNGQFEGAATAETFNVNGKTDILLRANGRNVFIAECKFWKGPKQYRETIDQLLGYTAWRDAKTAIIVFNRGTGLSTVLAGIKAETEGHKNFKRALPRSSETGFRYVFHHASDSNREFLLTVLVFDVPSVAAAT